MTESAVNSDLLKCENDFFTKESKTKSLLITKNAIKNSIISQISQNPIKTERISSSVLSRAKDFLVQTKSDVNIGENCDLVDENTDESEDNKQMIEINLMLFQNNELSKKDSSDEESDSTESSQSSSEDSDEDSPHNSDSEHNSNDKNNFNKNDN